MDVITRIKTLTAQRQWSQYRLAKEADLSQSTVANIFSRNTVPSIATLEFICAAFHMSLSDFFMEDENADTTTLSDAHKTLVCCWDILPPNQQRIILELMQSMKNDAE